MWKNQERNIWIAPNTKRSKAKQSKANEVRAGGKRLKKQGVFHDFVKVKWSENMKGGE